MRRSSKRRLGYGNYVLATIVLLLLAGVTYQVVGTLLDERRFPPPGMLVEVLDGYHLHVYCVGEGGPTVVLDAGGADSSLSWYLVQREVAQATQICAFDRMSFGWSDTMPRPHTSREYVSQQHALLSHAGLEAPYVLVGHSLGGLNAQLFAAQHPEKVAGLVLVDSAHPALYERLPDLGGQDKLFLQVMRIASRLGIVRLALNLGIINPVPQQTELPLDVRDMRRAELARSRQWDAAYEMNSRLTESAVQVRNANSVPEVPLVVIAHGVDDMFANLEPEARARAERVWQELQADLSGLTSQGQLVVAENSGHMIPLEEPEVVAAAILQVVDDLSDSD